MTRTLIALLFGGLIFAALPAYAQFDTSEGALSISPNPQYPLPNSTVQLTAESPLLDLANSDIEWTVNGAAAGSGQSIKLTVGAPGSATNVSVSVSGQSGDDSAQLTLIPTSIDLLWEADSYTPPFYRGRAVPTSGSTIRLFAVPHFVASDGTVIAVRYRRVLGFVPRGHSLRHRCDRGGRANSGRFARGVRKYHHPNASSAARSIRG